VATEVLALQIYKEGMIYFNYGFASAISVVLMLLVLVVGIGGLTLFRRREVIM
jgi:ABC-type sugar transport system permease subunit